jgi:hypothetical protein
MHARPGGVIPGNQFSMNPVSVTIHFYASNERFDLTIDDVYDGERDEQKTLTQEGGVMFRTEKGKKWFLKYSEFAFVFPATRKADAAPAPLMEAVA